MGISFLRTQISFFSGTVLYMWVSLSFIAIQLLVIGCIFVWKDHLYQMIKLDLDQSLEFYRDMPIVRDHWDHLQESLHCCGDEGPHTWQKVFFADDVTVKLFNTYLCNVSSIFHEFPCFCFECKSCKICILRPLGLNWVFLFVSNFFSKDAVRITWT